MLCAARSQQFATRAARRCLACAGSLLAARPGPAVNEAAGPDDGDLLSRLFADAKAGNVATVRIAPDLCTVLRHSGDTYDVRLWSGFDTISLAERLHQYGVAFGARRPSWDSRLKAGLRVADLAIKVVGGLCVIYYFYRNLPPRKDDSVANQHRKKKERKRGFAGVAGVDKALRELREVVACLRDPAAFARIGARCPRGILLTGPSGTGKTLLARCVAEEADCEFLSCSGSAFVELFVGRGSARVRNLFAKARSLAPCVVFIDEIDAIAKARGMLSHNDEREQTLNQILCELDGFEAKDDDVAAAPLVVLLAATNRPEILDDALVRPGRLDRCVVVPLPDEAGRREILKVHAARVRLAPGVSLERVAARADGFSGADLANVVNEGALLAVRGSADAVTTEHLLDAVAKAQEAKRATSRRGFESIVPEAD